MKRQCCIFFIPQPLFRLTALATISLSNHYLFGYQSHTIPNTNISPDLGGLAEILDDESVQTILLQCG